MGSNLSFTASSRRGLDEILEWDGVRDSSQPSGFPLPEIVLNSAFARLAKKAPRLPAGFWHHGYIGKFVVGILWPIATAQRVNGADYLASLFKAVLHETFINQM